MKIESRNIIILIIAFILLLSGLIIILYPIISNFFAMRIQTEAIKQYDEAISSSIDDKNIEKEFEEANKYNDNLVGEPLHDPFVKGSGYALTSNYLNILDFDGVMGYLEIPKISLKLPIYHGTGQEALEKGVGHVEITSFPIGGKSCHSVLIGHRGLPNAKLFTDLDQLELGDFFYVTVLNRILTYEVYDIETIEPNEFDKIQIIENRDLVTLVTCTPYGLNTHRLLIHAERSENINPDKELSNNIENLIIENNLNRKTTLYIILSLILIIIIIITYIIRKRRKNIER